ncbi:MAG: hypothetical protein EXR11_07145 [Rhodospirillaceae bacterium]|nr:hypothetical protein [Rhodospirillaceae bacterium]
MKILLRTVIRVLEGIAIAVVLVGAVIFIQLARGPLPLDPFVPYVETALNRMAPNYAFSIADAELNWRRLTRRPELTVQNVQVRAANGEVIAAFGSFDLSLDIPELIRGRLVVEHLGLARPVVRIVRAANGSFSLGLDANADKPSSIDTDSQAAGVANLILDGLRVSPDDAESGPALEGVDITDSTVVIVDELSSIQWLIPDASLRLLGQRETIEIAATLPVVGAGTTVSVDVAGRYTYEAGLLSLTASFNGLRPSVFAGLSPSLDVLKTLDAALKGRIDINIVPDNISAPATWGNFDITAGPGTLALPPEWGGAIAIDGASLKAAFSGGLDQIAVEKFNITIARTDGRSPVISATARAVNMRSAPRVDIQAKIDTLSLQALKDLWPQVIAPSTISWIRNNLADGVITNVTSTIGLRGDEAWSIAPETLSLRGDLAGFTVNYIDGMPKVERTSGVLNVGLNEVTIKVTKGDVPDAVSSKGLSVGPANLRMFDLGTDIPKADFDIAVTGDLGEALRLIENEPLQYASAMEVNPNQASGAAKIDLSLKFPLLNDLSLEQLQIGVKAKVTDTRIDDVAFGMPLTEGDLTLDVVNSGLSVSGTAKLGPIRTGLTWKEDFTDAPVRSEYALDALIENEHRALVQVGFAPFIPPNIDGTVRTEVVYRRMRDGSAALNAEGDLTDVTMAIPQLGWAKAAGTKASFQADLALMDGALLSVPAFTVTAENDLLVEGAATFGAGSAFKTLSIKRGKAGRTDLALNVTREDDGVYVMDVTGPVFDASYFWKELNKDESRGQDTAGDQAQQDQVPVRLTAKVGEMWLAKEAPLKDLTLSFERNRRAIQKIDLKSHVESGASFDFALSTKDGARTFTGESADGGGVVRSIGLFDDIKGGKLAITGKLSPQGAVEGQAEISDFKLVEAPLVARILSVAALTGIADELRGEGISFKTLRVPFTFSASTLRITDAEMFGNSLGLTALGSYRFPDSEIDMEGTVIPAYALNSALNAVPILGPLLTGTEKGGGIFAANFSWRGPSATAEPSVNPLSVLTPGITRKFFSIFGGSRSAAAPAQPSRQ